MASSKIKQNQKSLDGRLGLAVVMGRSWGFPVRFRVRTKDLGFCGATTFPRKARCSCGCAFICEGSGQSFCFVSRPLLDPEPPSSARFGASILQLSCWAASFSWGQTHCVLCSGACPAGHLAQSKDPILGGGVKEQMSKGTSSSCPSAGDQNFELPLGLAPWNSSS